MFITASTELEAVNEILSGIGESPINTLADTGNIDAANALRLVQKNSLALQSQGWHFNTFSEFRMNPDTNEKKIRWNPSIILIKDAAYIRRGDYVYDKDNATYEFTKPIEIEVVLQEAFEDLPEPARRFIVVKSMKEFQIRYLGVKELVETSMQEEQEAWADLMTYDMDIGRFNLMNNTNIQNNLKRTI